ncbi:hypothetical protein PHLCEN_2v3733 [Hermanssonia centrifuga]|uniref:Uncharacterized protein n=1 Tax=Hermanssonia centrifuga TaxID=98765 RepID=A0A2R6QBN7_9APHY|nr:hypothetical protein PHLCEN_2v3733 [Hermanssonia centrifuga]
MSQGLNNFGRHWFGPRFLNKALAVQVLEDHTSVAEDYEKWVIRSKRALALRTYRTLRPLPPPFLRELP